MIVRRQNEGKGFVGREILLIYSGEKVKKKD